MDIIAYYDPKGEGKLNISITTKVKILKILRKKYSSYSNMSMIPKETFKEGNLINPWGNRYINWKYVIKYYIFPMKDIYVYSSEFIKIKNKIDLFENLLKYTNMLYCFCAKNSQHIIIIYDNCSNTYDIYKKLFKIIPYINYYDGHHIEKISMDRNILQRNKDFHKRLDYLIDNSRFFYIF